MPRLELYAALTGAQLAKVLQTELTLPIQSVVMWSDSTIVLSWIQSESKPVQRIHRHESPKYWTLPNPDHGDTLTQT